MKNLRQECDEKLSILIEEFHSENPNLSVDAIKSIASYFYWFGLEDGCEIQSRQAKKLISSLPHFADTLSKEAP